MGTGRKADDNPKGYGKLMVKKVHDGRGNFHNKELIELAERKFHFYN